MAKRYYTPEQYNFAFWSKVAIVADDNLCWLWTASLDTHGYGHMRYNGKLMLSHKLAWMYPDYVIPDGMFILHSCDNPACCNPKHLFIGTHQDNMNDMVAKKRYRDSRGEKNGRCILSEEQIKEIRQKYSPQKRNRSALAREYGISKTQMARIVRYEQWKDIDNATQ